MSIKIKRIEKEFIIKSILQSQEPIVIKAKQKICNGFISKYNDREIYIQSTELQPDKWSLGEKISVFFSFLNITHTFDSSVLKIENQKMVIAQNDDIFKDLKRQFTRLHGVKDIEVQFKIKNRNITLSFPRTNQHVMISKPDQWPDISTKNIKELIEGFRKKLHKEGIENKINMLRNRKLENLEEKLIAWSGKSLWIPKTNVSHLPYISHSSEKLYLNQEDAIEYLIKNSSLPKEAEHTIQNMIKTKQEYGLASLAYTPLLFRDYMTGYILLHHYTKEIELNILDYTVNFSKILCYALQENNYFKIGQKENAEYKIPLIDISATGLLFAHDSQDLPKDLLLNRSIDIILKLNQTKLELKAKVVRKFKSNTKFYFALHFQELDNRKFIFLHKVLYGPDAEIPSIKKQLEEIDFPDMENDVF
ncbi:MAG: PilZ domain-containing protein [Spirochaetales bacterium]|nr:PilZ domain-containing protein [Spirochaetales bacterium]